jgi:hypothetical protein
MIVAVAVADAAAIDDHRVVQERVLALASSLELTQEVSERSNGLVLSLSRKGSESYHDTKACVTQYLEVNVRRNESQLPARSLEFDLARFAELR